MLSSPGTGVARVLLIDDDPQFLRFVSRVYAPLGLGVLSARTVAEGLTAATRQGPFAFAIVDLRLPDGSGLDALCALGAIPFVLATGNATTTATVKAVRLGALDVIEKPISPEQLCDLAVRVEGLGVSRHAAATGAHETTCSMRPRLTPADRWALGVWFAATADDDPKTLDLWAEAARSSVTRLGDLCRALGGQPHDSRDLGRVLRVAREMRATGEPFEVFVDASDPRTIDALRRRAGLAVGATPSSVDDVLARQHFVPQGHTGLAALRRFIRCAQTRHAGTCDSPCRFAGG